MSLLSRLANPLRKNPGRPRSYGGTDDALDPWDIEIVDPDAKFPEAWISVKLHVQFQRDSRVVYLTFANGYGAFWKGYVDDLDSPALEAALEAAGMPTEK